MQNSNAIIYIPFHVCLTFLSSQLSAEKNNMHTYATFLGDHWSIKYSCCDWGWACTIMSNYKFHKINAGRNKRGYKTMEEPKTGISGGLEKGKSNYPWNRLVSEHPVFIQFLWLRSALKLKRWVCIGFHLTICCILTPCIISVAHTNLILCCLDQMTFQRGSLGGL